MYGLVAEASARSWGVPARVTAAYVYASPIRAVERGYLDDYPELRAAAGEWTAMAGGLLRERCFPRTPDRKDCKFCRFEPVCGADAPARAAASLGRAGGAMADFFRLRTPGAPAEEE